MSSADWEEIKRLASDFEKAQLSTALQRLSEANCVEIINKLLELRLVEIVPSTDAKDYITPNQIIKEIKDEIYVAGGRIDTSKLASLLSVDFSIIESKASQVASSDKSIHLVLNQLVTDDYLDLIAEEINEKLQQNGSIQIGPLSRDYDLPGEFLQNVIKKRLGKIIRGEQDQSDPDTIFTEGFVARHKHQVRGVLSSITKPTSILSIINNFKLQERLFFQCAEKLIAQKVICGSLSSSRNARVAMYTPAIYSQAQHQWVKNALDTNGFIEYDALRRLGISDPEQYLKRFFGSTKELKYTPVAAIGRLIVEQIETLIEDAIVSSSFIDIDPYTPSNFPSAAVPNLIELALEKREESAKASGYSNPSTCQVFNDCMVFSDTLLAQIALDLETDMPKKAQELVRSGAFKQRLSNVPKAKEDDIKSKKEERRKKATGGKLGGGTQGRETKTKSVKKHKSKKHVSDDEEEADDGPREWEYLSREEIQEKLSEMKIFEDFCEWEGIVEYFYGPLKKKFQGVAYAAYESSMLNSAQERKMSFQQLVDTLIASFTYVKLCSKGIQVFDGELQSLLSKHLMRTKCTAIVDNLVRYLAHDVNIELDKEKALESNTRLNVINKLPEDSKKALLGVHNLLSQNGVEEFLEAADDAYNVAGILIKKKDNKKERSLLQEHRPKLLEQLHGQEDPALILHLACLILIHAVHGQMIEASGKFVPQILSHLQVHLNQQFCSLLEEYRDLVMQSISGSLGAGKGRLEQLTPQLKSMTVSFKKTRENSTSED